MRSRNRLIVVDKKKEEEREREGNSLDEPAIELRCLAELES